MAERDTTNELFASNMRRVRLARGMSQEELAEKAGLHRTYISAIERGERNISLKNVGRISEALGMEPGALLAGKPGGRDGE